MDNELTPPLDEPLPDPQEWPADENGLTSEDIATPPVSSDDADAVVEVDATAVAGLRDTAAATSVLEDYQREVREVAQELSHIETEVAAMLEGRDSRRKRKLAGTHRWHELEEDILSWKFTRRFEEPVLNRLQELIGRRHYLYRHLRFLASTRPVWNS